MYLDALSFLEDERDAWRPYEALGALTDEQLATPLDAAHGWSGRDLIAHMTAWQEHALTVARELAVNETSRAKLQGDADWATRGDAINEEIRLAWLAMPLTEVRSRFASAAGELRGYLTAVPETRWLKNSAMLNFFLAETTDHYEAHAKDLEAVLAAAR